MVMLTRRTLQAGLRLAYECFSPVLLSEGQRDPSAGHAGRDRPLAAGPLPGTGFSALGSSLLPLVCSCGRGEYSLFCGREDLPLLELLLNQPSAECVFQARDTLFSRGTETLGRLPSDVLDLIREANCRQKDDAKEVWS